MDLLTAYDKLAARVTPRALDPQLLTRVLYKQACGENHYAAPEVHELYPAAGVKALSGVAIVCPEKYIGLDAICHPGPRKQRTRIGEGCVAWFWEDLSYKEKETERVRRNEMYSAREFEAWAMKEYGDMHEITLPLRIGMAVYDLEESRVPSKLCMYATGSLFVRMLISLGRLINHGVPETDVRSLYEATWLEEII